MKIFLNLLLLIFSLPSFALVCFESEDQEGVYTCYAGITDGAYITGYGHVVPCPGGGQDGCTNCVKITPAECQQMKQTVSDSLDSLVLQADNIETTVGSIRNVADEQMNEIQKLLDEGDQFRSFSSLSDVPGDITVAQGNYLLSEPTRPYYNPVSSPARVPTTLLNMNNSIYNYYNQSVKPALEQIRAYNSGVYGYTQDILADVDSINQEVNMIRNTTSSVSCEPCSTGSAGGSGEGGTGEGCGTGSTGCDCLKCAQALIDYLTPQLDFLKEKVGDISNMVYTIKMDVSKFSKWISDANDFKKNGYEYDFTYEGKKIFNDGPAETGGFSLSDYSTFNWFQRVEFLLAGIYGAFNTNTFANADFSSKEKLQADDVGNQISNHVLRLTSLVSTLQSVSDQLATARSRLNPLSSHSFDSVPDKVILVDRFDVSTSVGGASKDVAAVPQLYIDFGGEHDGFRFSDVVEVSHDITRVIWLVLSTVVFVFAFYRFVLFVFWLISLYTKLYVAWCQTHFPA